MKCKLLALGIWGTDPDKKPNIIYFSTSAINVVVGKNKTGKSSIWHIFEYCMGSQTCRIPRSILLEKVLWFGIAIQGPERTTILCRENPLVGKSYHTYINRIEHDLSKVRPFASASLSKLRKEADEIMGPPISLGLYELRRKNQRVRLNRKREERFLQKQGMPVRASEQVDRKDQELSNRDFRTFCYLPQHIHSDRNVLFETYNEVPRQIKLRSILPLLLRRRSVKQQIARDDARFADKWVERESKKMRYRRQVFHKVFSEQFVKAYELDLVTSKSWVESDVWHPEKYRSEYRVIRSLGWRHSQFIRKALELLDHSKDPAKLAQELDVLKTNLENETGLIWKGMQTCYDRVLLAQQMQTSMQYLDRFASDFEEKEKSFLGETMEIHRKQELNENFNKRIREFAAALQLANLDQLAAFDTDEATFFSVGKEHTRFLTGVGGSYDIFGYHLALFMALHFPEDDSHSEMLDSFILIDSPGKALDSVTNSTSADNCRQILKNFLLRFVGESPDSAQIIICDKEFDHSSYPSGSINEISFEKNGLVPEDWSIITPA